MNRQQNEKSDETQKARKLIDKDMSNVDKRAGHEGSHARNPNPFAQTKTWIIRKLKKSLHHLLIIPLSRKRLYQVHSWRRRKKRIKIISIIKQTRQTQREANSASSTFSVLTRHRPVITLSGEGLNHWCVCIAQYLNATGIY